MKLINRTIIAALLSSLAFMSTTQAQGDEVTLQVRPYHEYIKPARLRDVGSGDLATSRTGVGMTLGVQRNNRQSTLKVGTEKQRFSFPEISSMALSGAAEPLEGLQQDALSLGHLVKYDADYSILYGLGISSGREKQSGDSWSYSAHGALKGKYDIFTWIAGIGVVRAPLISQVYPLLGLSLGTSEVAEGEAQGDNSGTFSAQIGFPSTEIRYHYLPGLDFYCTLSAAGGVYRLREDSPLAERGVLRSFGYTSALMTDMQISQNTMLSFGLTGHLNRRWQVVSADGDPLAVIRCSNALGGVLTLTSSF